MKKKILGIFLFAVFTTFVTTQVYIFQNAEGNILKNIEALASDESSVDDATEVTSICAECGGDEEVCFPCIEDGCSCSPATHTCS